MNFSTVRGYNAYAQFSMTIREAVKLQETPKVQEIEQDRSGSVFSDPVDIVSISHTARSMSLSMLAERETAQLTLREWIKESGSMNGVISHRVSGQTMSELLASNNISVDENESFNINVDVWCAVTVTGKNAEKAKAIQVLLNTTPSGINWDFLLQKLPVER